MILANTGSVRHRQYLENSLQMALKTSKQATKFNNSLQLQRFPAGVPDRLSA